MQETYTIPNGNNRKNVKGHISLCLRVANTSSLSFGLSEERQVPNTSIR